MLYLLFFNAPNISSEGRAVRVLTMFKHGLVRAVSVSVAILLLLRSFFFVTVCFYGGLVYDINLYATAV